MVNTVFSNRTDRLGARMVAIFNALIVADQLDYECKIGWKHHPYKEIKDDGFREIFTKEFIEKHIIEFSEVPDSVQSLSQWVENEQKGDIIINNCFGKVQIQDSKKTPKSFDEIMRSNVVKNEILQYADEISRKVSEELGDSVAFHIRRGDLLTIDLGPQAVSFIDRYNPLEVFHELATQILADSNSSILVYSDDSSSIFSLPTDDRVKSIEDFIPDNEFTLAQQALLEIIIMSKQKRIFGSWSAFSELASLIGGITLSIARDEIDLEICKNIFLTKAVQGERNSNESIICLASYIDLIVSKMDLPDWSKIISLVKDNPNSYNLVKKVLYRGQNRISGGKNPVQNRSDSAVLYQISAIARAAGELEESIDVASDAVKLDPRNYGLYHHLGNLYFTAGDYKSALVNQKIASKSESGIKISSLVQLCRIYSKTEDWDKLVEVGNQLLQIKPDSTDALNAISLGYAKKSDHSSSRLLSSSVLFDHWFRGKEIPVGFRDPKIEKISQKSSVKEHPLIFLCSIGKFDEEDDFWLKKQLKNSLTALEVGGIDYTLNFSFSDVDNKFIQRNPEIFSIKRGAGLWLWKPHIISRSLEKISEGDYLVYCDSGAFFNSSIKGIIENWALDAKDAGIMTFGWGGTESHWTKRDSFIIMECDTEEIRNSSPQVWGGLMIIKKCENSINFVNDWVNYCSIFNNISDSPSELGEDDPEFKEHRHDQSILSLLSKRNGIFPSNLSRILWKDAQKGKLNEKHIIVSTRRNNDISNLKMDNYAFFYPPEKED